MTFLEQFQAHKGGLIQLKSQLYWYGGRGYDGNPGRVCLILDAATAARRSAVAVAAISLDHAAARRTTARVRTAVAYLLLDDSPQWVWAAEEDVEFL